MTSTVGLQQTVSDTSELTGLPSFGGFISSSVQISTSISGSFTSGFGCKGTISGSTSNSTASFGRVDNINSITGDVSELSGLSIPTNSVSGSLAQIATAISGALPVDLSLIIPSVVLLTSTGSFNRLNFNSLSVTDLSGITGYEAVMFGFKCNCFSQISASFQGDLVSVEQSVLLLILPLEYSHLI